VHQVVRHEASPYVGVGGPAPLETHQGEPASGGNVGRMARLASMRWMALLGVLLSACVTSPSTGREEHEAPEAVSSSWDEARADPSCVVPLCDAERCAFWRCQTARPEDVPPPLLPGAA